MIMRSRLFPDCIRPMIFENSDSEWRFSARGTCFLAKCENRIFALTARHVIDGYNPSQYRIPNRLGSHNMLPIRQPFAPEFYRRKEVDFEDFVVIPIDVESIIDDDFDERDAYLISEGRIEWSAIQQVGVFGFPDEVNLVDYDQQLISIQPCAMIGEITSSSIGDGMREIEFGPGELRTYDGFSGSPAFEMRESRKIGRLLGIVLRGSHDTSLSRRAHFLDVCVVAPLIRHHLQQTELC
jgi:hypothetical protein